MRDIEGSSSRRARPEQGDPLGRLDAELDEAIESTRKLPFKKDKRLHTKRAEKDSAKHDKESTNKSHVRRSLAVIAVAVTGTAAITYNAPAITNRIMAMTYGIEDEAATAYLEYGVTATPPQEFSLEAQGEMQWIVPQPDGNLGYYPEIEFVEGEEKEVRNPRIFFDEAAGATAAASIYQIEGEQDAVVVRERNGQKVAVVNLAQMVLGMSFSTAPEQGASYDMLTLQVLNEQTPEDAINTLNAAQTDLEKMSDVQDEFIYEINLALGGIDSDGEDRVSQFEKDIQGPIKAAIEKNIRERAVSPEGIALGLIEDIDISFKNTLNVEVPAKYPEIDSPYVDIADDSIEISRFEIKKPAEAQE